MFRNLFPGFGTAVVAFTAYVLFDNLVAKTHKEAKVH
jgi:NADH dehydrogenase (ubiquinone) 1 beta subcomplex subunit 3